MRYREQMKGQKKKKGKSHRGRWSRRVGSRKGIKQEKDKGSREVFNLVEGIHGRRQYLGEEKKNLKKCRGS